MNASTNAAKTVGQRADLTFKHNLREARHGWLRLTPAYSVKVVEDVLRDYSQELAVLDPFSGTATTTLCATTHGHTAVSVDINPFLVWFGKAKVAHYVEEVLSQTREASLAIADTVARRAIAPDSPPPIAHISRWWNERSLSYLCLVKAAVARRAGPGQTLDLLKIAFCRTLIEVSNAAFNHQSVSFKDNQTSSTQRQFWADDVFAEDPFSRNVDVVLQSANANPSGNGHVLLGDARSLDGVDEARFDLLLTSPPYPNRMSYIRELRPYMYWLDFLAEAREAGELDWQAIGGTWGIATSRLADWRLAADTWLPPALLHAVEDISKADSKSGPLLANYVAKYFEDMWLHFNSVKRCMKTGAKAHYIVGNSKFYDVLVPVESFYAEMLEKAGFHAPTIHVLRKRNSKKELLEFDVSAVV